MVTRDMTKCNIQQRLVLPWSRSMVSYLVTALYSTRCFLYLRS